MRNIRLLPGFVLSLGLLALLAGLPGSNAAGPPAQPTADAARMLNFVRHFSEDGSSQPISRYAYRVEMDALQADLRNQMAEALGPRGTAELWAFPSRMPPGIWDPQAALACGALDPLSPVHAHPTFWPAGGTIPFRSTFNNVIGRLPGTNPGAGKFVICSHFDAIGFRTPGWQAWADPAPGADDNLSGTAAVVELARLLASEAPLPFDLEFVCFDGEELGLWGSDTLAHAERKANAPILGVFNMDMVGFNPVADSLVIMPNRESWYLADFVRETEALDPQPSLSLQVTIDNLVNSDHGPYWLQGYTAFMMIENLNVVRNNPQYHRVTDRASTLRGGVMMAKAANVYLKALRRLAERSGGPPDLRISETDLIMFVNGSPEGRVAVPGDEIRVEGGIFNAGGSTEGMPIHVSWYSIGNDGKRNYLETTTVTTPVRNGGHLRVPFVRTATAADVGALTIEMELDDGTHIDTARRAIPVKDTVGRVVSHYMAPNPVRAIESASLQYELSREADVRITLFDAHGTELGRRYYEDVSGTRQTSVATNTGLNRVPLADLFGAFNPAPGIYLYRIEVFGDDAVDEMTMGKFALLR
ncbi:MAG TPA: M28 family peptidase [Candidatus Eisenbacteria bacterium]